MEKNINIDSIIIVAKALKELLPKIVFVGGATVSLYADDPASDEIRPTDDLDLTIQLTGYSELVKLQKRLTELGFLPNPFGHAICSYLYEDISLDIMPSEDGPLGKANSWYKPGFDFLKEIILQNIKINILSAPYFLATKFEAFNDRGKDHRTSHDFEDIIYIIDNRINVVDEIRSSDKKVRNFLNEEFSKIMKNPNLEEIISSQLNPHSINERYPIVIKNITDILS
jgi:predicted nucleotidyltransferase